MLPAFSAFVLYAFIWFLTLLVVLPIRLQSQADTGQVERGTPSSAPANPQMRKRLIATTIAATVIWALVAGAIVTGVLTADRLSGLSSWAMPR